MSLVYNGVQVKSTNATSPMIYNGTRLDKMIMDGVIVCEKKTEQIANTTTDYHTSYVGTISIGSVSKNTAGEKTQTVSNLVGTNITNVTIRNGNVYNENGEIASGGSLKATYNATTNTITVTASATNSGTRTHSYTARDVEVTYKSTVTTYVTQTYFE